MFARISLLLAAAACVPAPSERVVTNTHALAELRLRVPDGSLAAYDGACDCWWVSSAHSRAVIDAAPREAVASPEALRQAMHSTATIESRESLSDGFAATLVEHSGAPSDAPRRDTIVIRQLGNAWLRCRGDAMLCKSVKRS